MSRWLQANYKRKAGITTLDELIKAIDSELKASGDMEPFTEKEFWDADPGQLVDDLSSHHIDVNSDLFRDVALKILTGDKTDYSTVQYFVDTFGDEFVNSKYFKELFNASIADNSFLAETLFEYNLIDNNSPYYTPAKNVLIQQVKFDPELGENLVKKGILDESEINN